MSMNTLSLASMGQKGCLSGIGNQKEITISLLTMRTTRNRGENQKFIRKVREESVEVI